MGTTVNGIYLPGHLEQGWDDEVNDNLRRLGDLAINVKGSPFNAVGDGVADDTAAIQAALDTAAASGGRVLIPGVHKCVSALTINADNVTLAGVNKLRSKIVFGNAVNPGLDLGDNVTQRHYITLENLTLTRETAGGGPILRGRKIDQCIFRECQFAAGTTTVSLDQFISSSIMLCGISASTATGMQITNSDQVQVISNYFEDQDASSNHLIFGSGNKNVSITGNNFSTGGGSAIQVGTGSNTEFAIVGNTVENCVHGIVLRAGGVGLTRGVVSGNALRGTNAVGSIGFQIGSENSDLVISGNTVTNYVTNYQEASAPGSNVVVVGNPGLGNRRHTQVVATASLPAAAAAMDGTTLIEDNGTGDRNLVIYAGGQRFRIDGGAAF